MVYLPRKGEFCRPPITLQVFCSMLALWRWGRYPVAAFYIRYPYKNYNTIGNY